MKNNLKICSLLVVVALLACILSACAGGVDKSGTATILVDGGSGEYTVYSVDLSKLDNVEDGAISLLEYLSTDKKSDLRYTAESSTYGAYITSINEITPDPLSEYIAIYTSEVSDFSVSADGMEMPSIKYGEIELQYSGVGLGDMTVKDGTVILLRLESFL